MNKRVDEADGGQTRTTDCVRQPPARWRASTETPEAALEVKRAKGIAADRPVDSRRLVLLLKNIEDEALKRRWGSRDKRGDVQVARVVGETLRFVSATPVKKRRERTAEQLVRPPSRSSVP